MNYYRLKHGDMRKLLRALPDNFVHSVVCDPPYDLGFMGKSWDKTGIAFDLQTWREVLRVLKPGGHLLAFGGTRTHHRMVTAIEDAGFEIRDGLMWLYGSGFPKSLDVSKAVDATLLHGGANSKRIAEARRSRDVIEVVKKPTRVAGRGHGRDADGNVINKGFFADEPQTLVDYAVTAPTTPQAQQWEGWGTALKPAYEPIVLARKPMGKNTVARSVLEHGTGALNIQASRYGTEQVPINKLEQWSGFGQQERPAYTATVSTGRWPANVMHDESHDLMEEFSKYGEGKRSVARFFYSPKVSKKERHEAAPNNHPTLKPLALMRYLVRLITPPKGIVLDPFMGSGSTGVAALREGFNFYGCELEQQYFEVATSRLSHVVAKIKAKREAFG